ncbi:hypothetical protein, partial [Thiolapillus sp.]|uniref:hypothetical protein n=1 Tax=Thiolapillus sp. TaxID=2017437 RepID=UPI0025D9B020
PENPSVFGRIGARKSLCIMHLGLYPSLSLPTDSAEEPNFLSRPTIPPLAATAAAASVWPFQGNW